MVEDLFFLQTISENHKEELEVRNLAILFTSAWTKKTFESSVEKFGTLLKFYNIELS